MLILEVAAAEALRDGMRQNLEQGMGDTAESRQVDCLVAMAQVIEW